MEQLMRSNEWQIVKGQLEEEKKQLFNTLLVNGFNWSESQVKASLESIKVYENIIDAPENIFRSYGGNLQVEE